MEQQSSRVSLETIHSLLFAVVFFVYIGFYFIQFRDIFLENGGVYKFVTIIFTGRPVFGIRWIIRQNLSALTRGKESLEVFEQKRLLGQKLDTIM